jgi:hypothetical protein
MNKETTTPPATNVKIQGDQIVVTNTAPVQPAAVPAKPKKEFVSVAAPKNMTLIEATEARKTADIILAATPKAKKTAGK